MNPDLYNLLYLACIAGLFIWLLGFRFTVFIVLLCTLCWLAEQGVTFSSALNSLKNTTPTYLKNVPEK